MCELYLDPSSALLRAGDAASANRELVECIDLASLGEGFTTVDGPESFWRILREQLQIVDSEGDAYRGLRLAEAAAVPCATRALDGSAPRACNSYSRHSARRSASGNKAERYRQLALSEMRNLGDRRATAELLLTDVPTPGAVVVSSRLQDAMTLTKEIGWAEGHDRARRKSEPPTNASS